MTRRLLSPVDYALLKGTPLEVLAPYLPDGAQVLIVEDEAGAVIGTWSAFPLWHLEGFWIAESYRRRGSVARRLLRGMQEVLTDVDATRVTTAADTDEMCAWLERLGAQELPGHHFVWPVKES